MVVLYYNCRNSEFVCNFDVLNFNRLKKKYISSTNNVDLELTGSLLWTRVSNKFNLNKAWQYLRYLKRYYVCRPRAKKFNAVSNDNGRTQKCDLFVLEQKYRFWANLVQKIKIVTLTWKLVSRIIPTCTI